MSFFTNILDKLGLHKEAPAATPASAAPASAKTPVAAAGASGKSVDASAEKIAAAKDYIQPAVKAVSEVDVVKKLEQLSKGSDLDWKVSIVDMLKVLGLDSSKDARIGLAKELGCPAELIGGDYSKMNVWLHKTVLQKIAENGGNIPQSLLK